MGLPQVLFVALHGSPLEVLAGKRERQLRGGRFIGSAESNSDYSPDDPTVLFTMTILGFRTLLGAPSGIGVE